MKLLLIHLADAFDNYILRHKFYSICNKIGASDWWGTQQCNCHYCVKCGTDSDWRSENKNGLVG